MRWVDSCGRSHPAGKGFSVVVHDKFGLSYQLEVNLPHLALWNFLFGFGFFLSYIFEQRACGW